MRNGKFWMVFTGNEDSGKLVVEVEGFNIFFKVKNTMEDDKFS